MELTANIIQKYAKFSVPDLIKKAQTHFNAFIRERDKDKRCISCPRGKTEQAGHYYSAGHYSSLRYNEDNTHGQCVRCNYFLSGNQIGYRKGLEKRIGKERLETLDNSAVKKAHKWDRFTLITIIEKYKVSKIKRAA